MDKYSSKKSVAVLMATYNGEKYLREQIDSILSQEGVEVHLFVRDDGSTDGTLSLLQEYKQAGLLSLCTGKNIGPAKNFHKLLIESGEYDYYAFSDQDDVWDLDKLRVGVSCLEYEKGPALYHASARKVDSNGKYMCTVKKKPAVNFGAALVTSDVQGSTSVLNKELRKYIMLFTPDFDRIKILHDAWIHKVCLAVGGMVYYDPTPHISYRIHANNVVANVLTQTSIIEKVKRYFVMPSPHFYEKTAMELLNGYEKYISEDNRNLAYVLINYRKGIKNRFGLAFHKRIHTGDWKKNVSFRINVLLGRA